MLNLPSVTLLCADCVDADRAVRTIAKCTSVANFGAVKFLTHLPSVCPYRIEIPCLPSLIDYSIFMLKNAVKFVDTKHCLVVQHDGYIINPEAWNSDWLNYDYIGPIFIQDHAIDARVGSGGFSLRTKKLMEFVAKRTPEWDGSPESTEAVQKKLGSYEDGVICHGLRPDIVKAGMKFAPPSAAAKFAQGGYPHIASRDPHDRQYYVERPFGHHGGWSNINRETGFVSPPPFI